MGDGDQSIYRFRGADIRNILEFEEAFPDATVIVLEQNYRSTQTILDAANAVIANNLGRKPKDLWTDQGDGEPIIRYHADDEGDEAQWVAHEIADLHDAGEHRWGDVAVFYRTNAQSRVLEEALMRVGIPYKVVGGTRFYDRREVKDALPTCRRWSTPPTRCRSSASLNVPKRGIGDTTVGRLDAWADGHGVTVHRGAAAQPTRPGVSGRARQGHRRRSCRCSTSSPSWSPRRPGDAARAGRSSAPATSPSCRPSTRSRPRAASRTWPSSSASAREFDDGRRVPRAGEPRGRHRRAPTTTTTTPASLLMTLHAAKGLEFPVVFLLGMEDGVFPHLRSLGEPDELEEERRLAYVGITRARRAAVPHPRLEPHALRHRRSTTRPAASSTRSPSTSSSTSRVAGGPREAAPGATTAGSTPIAARGRRAGRAARELDRFGDPERRAATCSPQGPSRSGADGIDLKVGDDVRHATFGEGVIIALQGAGDKAEARVNFRGKGEKQLLLAWAPLEKLS